MKRPPSCTGLLALLLILRLKGIKCYTRETARTGSEADSCLHVVAKLSNCGLQA